MATPWTYFLHLSLPPVILIGSSAGSPAHVLMLSIQAARSLPHLRSNSLVSPSFPALTVSNSFLFTPASLRTHSFVFFAVHETRRTSQSPFISKASRRVSSFFLRVQLSQPYVATGHTSAFISRIFVEIGML